MDSGKFLLNFLLFIHPSWAWDWFSYNNHTKWQLGNRHPAFLGDDICNCTLIPDSADTYEDYMVPNVRYIDCDPATESLVKDRYVCYDPLTDEGYLLCWYNIFEVCWNYHDVYFPPNPIVNSANVQNISCRIVLAGLFFLLFVFKLYNE